MENLVYMGERADAGALNPMGKRLCLTNIMFPEILRRPCARRAWWPSAAACAFLASGLEILAFGFFRYLYALEMPVIRENGHIPSGLVDLGMYGGLTIWVIGMAAQGTAVWGITRRQQAIAPVSARWGQWAFVTYIVVSGLVYFLMPLAGFVFSFWFSFRPIL
ncbi:MAG: hypothetical protein JO091_04795, partial [Acidobacteriaceae bacterium]|nr:hypothetical protein [Acidobacteriaceae bacterium]